MAKTALALGRDTNDQQRRLSLAVVVCYQKRVATTAVFGQPYQCRETHGPVVWRVRAMWILASTDCRLERER